MSRLLLLQIGDVHFPDMEGLSRSVDHKDHAAPLSLVNIASPDRFRNSLHTILRLCDARSDEIAALLICGDLTSRGQIDGYRTCVKYLSNCLQLNNPVKWHPDRIHAVPGNHDVDRNQCDRSGLDLFVKFDQLEQAWAQLGLQPLPTRSPRITTLTINGNRISLASLNSCLGCGELRVLPEQIRKELGDLLQPYIATQATAKAFELVGETLDSPAFSAQDIFLVDTEVQKLPSEQLPIILAHHNLLPQALPRFEIYTEAINGGMVRSRLINRDRPILYCHGHIHCDPVEVILDPTKPDGRIVSVSAPMLMDGFNLLEIHYSRKGSPLGIIVHQYRTDTNGGVTNKPVRVPLQGPRHIQHIRDTLAENVMACLSGAFMKFLTLRQSVAARRGTAPNFKSLADTLEDLAWLGLVEIYDHHDQDFESWQIRKVQP